MAQVPSDLSNDRERAVGRRLGILMAAAEIEKNRRLALLIGVSEAQMSKYRQGRYLDSQKRIDSIAKALAGRGDLTEDWKAVRDFLEFRTNNIPWSDSALSEANRYFNRPAPDQVIRDFRVLA